MLLAPPLRALTWVIPLTWMLLSGACSVPRLDIASKACPCARGWVCDPRSNSCVEGNLVVSEPSSEEPAPGSGTANGGHAHQPTTTVDDAGILPPTSADASYLDAGEPPADRPGPEPAAGDAAAPDASSAADAALDVVSPCQAPATEPLLYDSFESDHRGFAEGGGTSSIDRSNQFAHSGSGALRTQVSYPTIGARVSQTLAQPMSDGTLYAETFLFVDATVQPRSFSVLALSSQQSGQGIRLFYTRDGLQLQVDAAQATLPLGPTLDTIGRWVKFEIVATLGVEGDVRVCIDGQQALSSPMNTQVEGGYSRVELGIVHISNDQGRVILYADDFVLRHADAAIPVEIQ